MSVRSWIIFAGMIGVLFAMIIVYGFAYDPREVVSERSELEAVTGDTLRVTAVALAKEYDKDRRRTERVFKDRLCAVTGAVLGTDVNWLGEPVVQLKGTSSQNGMVSFMFRKAQEGLVGMLREGTNVTILGVCVGREPRYGVRFKQCRILMRP